LYTTRIGYNQINAITETTAVITWSTDTASNNGVQYGTGSDSWSRYPNTKSDTTLVTSHSITLNDLTQQTD
jgi:hypothetical protein